MERKEIVTNFARLTAFDGGGRYEVVKNAAGDETGIRLRGRLTTFDMVNVNDMAFKLDSYDKFVDGYYQANGLNVPVCLQHDDTDVRNLCGIVEEMKKTEEGVDIVVNVPKGVYYYNLIKLLIDNGVLQGFSNCGAVMDADTNEEGSLVIKDFALLHVALVTIPADTGAKLVRNTIFNGFGKREDKKEEKKIKEEVESWQW